MRPNIIGNNPNFLFNIIQIIKTISIQNLEVQRNSKLIGVLRPKQG